MGDLIFSTIESWQNGRPWGRLLDAGTGQQSLTWCLGLLSDSVTAITGSQQYANELTSQHTIRSQDRLLADNWTNRQLLADETFDTVLVDYLFGACDAFAPYFQTELFDRLSQCLSAHGDMYVVGMEPIPSYSDSKTDRLVIELTALRDACILLAGHRCYREYPMQWMQAQAKKSGFIIQNVDVFPIRYRSNFLLLQADVAESKLPFIRDLSVREALANQLQNLRQEIATHIEENGPITFGFDYLLHVKKGQ